MSGDATLVLHLSGPMQSWGLAEGMRQYGTHRAPTKSGVAGLLGAALGRERGDSLADLGALPMAVRHDVRGSFVRDFQTVGNWTPDVNADLRLGIPGKDLDLVVDGRPSAVLSQSAAGVITDRYYIADAAFVVALGGELSVLGSLAEALRAPHYGLVLGRRSCPADFVNPVVIDADVRTVLDMYPRYGGGREVDELPARSRITMDEALVRDSDVVMGSRRLRDVPEGYSPSGRRVFGTRIETTVRHDFPVLVTEDEEEPEGALSSVAGFN